MHLSPKATVKEITMEAFAFSITVMAAAIVLIVLIQMIREKVAEMEQTGEIRPKEASSGATRTTDTDDTQEYNEIDCFDDCMRAFRWQRREEGECARSCGLGR
jgi:hypothetical protein